MFNFLFVGGEKKKKGLATLIGIHDFFPPPVVLMHFNFMSIDIKTHNVRIMLALMTFVT